MSSCPCPPADALACGDPVCCNQRYRYVQPKVRDSCKPDSCYVRPSVPFESDTVYKESYIAVTPTEMALCKLPSTKPHVTANMDRSILMESNTVQSISYPGHYGITKQQPITPCARSLLGQGPMQDLTTQRHDYVAKPIMKRCTIIPQSKMVKTDAPMEQETVQKQSYIAPCLVKTESYKPTYHYKMPEIPMEDCTTQKLSYLPVQPQPRETPTWARKSCFSMPNLPVEKETTYKLSYMPNCGESRTPVCPPPNNILITASRTFDDSTTYAGSYYPPAKCQRVEPIRPVQQVNYRPIANMETETVQKMSYPGHYCVERQPPLAPCPRSLLGEGPMQDLTTQKHDFTEKPISRRQPIVPCNKMIATNAPMENDTTFTLSYITPVVQGRTVSYKPDIVAVIPTSPMETTTTQKESYLPICPQKKEDLPWSKRPCYQLPQVPMETYTTQILSYMPPGEFVPNDCPCSPCNPSLAINSYPKASDY